jgi:hypothetical protein
MAVSTLSHSQAHASLVATSLPPGLLAATLLAPALDLLAIVQRGAAWPMGEVVLAAIGAVLLLGAWARYPRTGWLAAAALAATASVALRLAGAEVAPVLSLLMVIALGVGGAFASPPREVDAWLA